jgi:RND family efflux transporter MFP subunit
VVEMIDLQRLAVVVNVPERHFTGARKGARARVTFESIPHLDVEGAITAIIPVADPQARTFPVKVEIANHDRAIGVGMSARVAFPSGAASEAVVVPKDAVVSEGAVRLVYTIEPGPPGEDGTPSQIAARTPVTLGAAIGDWIEVRGVEEGAEVVTRGNERLFPGSAVLTETVEYPAP